MDLEQNKFDDQTLRGLYDKHLQELSNALLAGADWKDVQEKRQVLIELSKQLFQRGISNPAEHPSRT